MSASVLYMSMSLDGYIAGPNDNRAIPAATDSTGFTSGWGTFLGRPGPSGNCMTRCTRPVHCWRVGALWSRSNTGAVTMVAGRSSSSATGRPVRPSRTIRW